MNPSDFWMGVAIGFSATICVLWLYFKKEYR